MRLRQIAFVAKDLKATTEELCDVLGIEVAYRDPGVGKWGLENIVAPIGGAFLEIVAPKEEGTSAGRYLARRHGDGGSNRQQVTEREWDQSPPNRGSFALLHPESDREQPAHPGIEAVKGAQSRQCEPERKCCMHFSWLLMRSNTNRRKRRRPPTASGGAATRQNAGRIADPLASFP